MDPRLTRLKATGEKIAGQLTLIERDLAVIKSDYATKSDVADAKAAIIMWGVGAVFLANCCPR